MGSQLLASTVMQQDNGSEWVLEYYIQTYDSADYGNVYGIKVDKCTMDGQVVESEETFGTTDKKHHALEMVNAFHKGVVPPSVLLEMVDEWESCNSHAFPSCVHTAG